MEIASLALASASAAHELFKCGQRIYKRIKDEQKLVLVLHEFRMFDLEDRQEQLNIVISLAQGVLKSPIVDQEHKDRLERNWKRIKALLSEIDDLIDTMIRNASWTATRARHDARDRLLDLGGTMAVSKAVQEFQSLVFAVRELEKEDSPLELSDMAFQPLDLGHRIYNAGKDACLGKGRLTDPMPGIPNTIQWFLFEMKPYENHDDRKKEVLKQNVRILAQKLHRAQEQMGILRLIGFRDEVNGKEGAFQLLFVLPMPSQKQYPDSLSQSLQAHPAKPSLNFRVSLCNQLAMAVLETMTLGLVHKNIRPDNILLLPAELTMTATAIPGKAAPSVFLTGWQYARQVERGVTQFRGETSIQRRVYQHPERQLVEAEREYSMAHDLYSLGVCMVEILMWESLLLPTDPPSMSTAFVTAFESLGLHKDSKEPFTMHAEQVQQTLVHMCDQHVPVIAGEKMARLVKGFLTSLDYDEEGEEDADQTQYKNVPNDKERRQVAVHFVNTALKVMRDVQSTI